MSSPTPRASLLAGLRTGGVRKSSSNIPLTASLSSSTFTHSAQDNHLSKSLTAAVDGPTNSFSLQQQSVPMNPNSIPFSPALPNNIQAQAQALQFQMMQLEILRLQNLQAQKYQADLLAEAHRQQLSQIRRPTPATAGPANPSFDIRPPTQIRRALDSSKPSSHLAVANDDKLPMSAALGGKFGSRTPSSSLASSLRFVAAADSDDSPSTTVISGGTALGTPPAPSVSTPSKSDAAISWRRGGNNNSVLSGNNRSPSVKVTPPPTDRISPPIPDRNSPPLATHVTKARPVPLRFSPAVSQPLPVVAVDGSPTDTVNSIRADDGYSTSSSSRSLSSPTTPRSASSSNDLPLSPREEATKKLYEGLGIGRPTMVVVDPPTAHSLSVVGHRLASLPMRQPRGPPSGTDELGPQNFATRLRRKAIGGLGAALLSARERREVVEAY